MSKNKVGPILRQLGVTYHGPNYGYLGAHGAAVSGIDVAWTWYNGKKAKNVYFWGPNGQIMSPFCPANLLFSNRNRNWIRCKAVCIRYRYHLNLLTEDNVDLPVTKCDKATKFGTSMCTTHLLCLYVWNCVQVLRSISNFFKQYTWVLYEPSRYVGRYNCEYFESRYLWVQSTQTIARLENSKAYKVYQTTIYEHSCRSGRRRLVNTDIRILCVLVLLEP